jgi:hypothetical protein
MNGPDAHRCPSAPNGEMVGEAVDRCCISLFHNSQHYRTLPNVHLCSSFAAVQRVDEGDRGST